MSHKLITLGLCSTALAISLLVAYAQPLPTSPPLNEPKEIVTPKPVGFGSTSVAPNNFVQTAGSNVENVARSRNLALQPEAIKLSRRLGGERFKSKIPPTLITLGVLSRGTDRQEIQIARSQNAIGERVEIALASETALLSWDATSGARSSTAVLSLTERTLLERLIFDSSDQFILAQLRGASYYVVARNLRPDDAADNYSGPLWDVVRIDDPEPDEQKRPLSRWRLYYLNSTTGLIDKIVCESEGERIEASFSDWTERAGEKFPSTITWTSQGQTLMTFNLTNVSFAAQ